MKFYFPLLLCLFFLFNSYGQDTVYSVRYPEGLVVDSLTLIRKKYYVFPLQNSTRRVVIPIKNLKKIHYSHGAVFKNKKMNPKDYFYLNTNSLTAEIEYREELPLSQLKTDLRTNLADLLSMEDIGFRAVYRSKDSAIYQVQFTTEHAGDEHLTHFKLNYIIENEKVVIKTNDLHSNYKNKIIYNKQNPIKSTVFDISNIYAKSRRLEDKKTYWNIIKLSLENTIRKAKSVVTKTESKFKEITIVDSLNFRHYSYVEGLTGYANYSSFYSGTGKIENRNLISYGARFGMKWNFIKKKDRYFGLGLNIGTFEMFIGDRGAAFSMSAGEVGPTFTYKINKKSRIEIGLNLGASLYFRMTDGFVGFSPTGESMSLKSNLELKYRFQKFIIGMQGSYRYPLQMIGSSILVGYRFN